MCGTRRFGMRSGWSREGAIGPVVHFRGVVDEDYQADPELSWSWRARLEEAGLGALGDLRGAIWSAWPAGSAARSRAWSRTWRRCTRRGRCRTGRGAERVENEDVAGALLRFEGGVTGVIATSRAAWGRKNRLGWEVHGEAGDDRLRAGADERAAALRQRGAGGAPRGSGPSSAGPRTRPMPPSCRRPGTSWGSTT